MRTQRSEARIELRFSELDCHLKQRNLLGAHERAQFIGVHRSTLERLEDGTCLPSDRFIAHVLAAFPDLKFEDLFEVAVPADQKLKDAS